MIRRHVSSSALVLSLILVLGTTTAFAGKSSGSSRSWSSSSRGSAVRSSSYKSSGSTTYKSFKPLSSTGSKSSYGNKSSYGRSSYSVLDHSSSMPSPKLQSIIRERENSGPGWIGTGLLVWLLSQHDLSSSDRAWIQQQIDDAGNDTDTEAPPLIEASDTGFTWQMPPTIEAGQPVKIAITAVAGADKKNVVPVCSVNGVVSQVSGNQAILTWTPHDEVNAVIDCSANGWNDMRLIRISHK
ncbi:TPA: hypothetical protein ACF3I9_004398 [Klebsiella aerogenes]